MYTLIFVTLFSTEFYINSQDDCLDTLCSESRQCLFVKGAGGCRVDAPTCHKSLACKYFGHCTTSADGEVCLATTAKDCAASKRCKSEGICAFVPPETPGESGECIPKDNRVCRKSPTCKKYGRCTHTFLGCSLTSSADCRHTSGCSGKKDCDYFVRRGFTGVPKCENFKKIKKSMDEEELKDICQESHVCDDFGQCHFDGKGCGSKRPEQTCKTFAPVVVKAVTASSTHKPGAGYTFEAGALTDNDPKTSWQPHPEFDGGVGEWLRFELEGPTEIVRVHIRNGFQHKDAKFGDLFKANNRIELLALWRGKADEFSRWYDEDTRETVTPNWFATNIDYSKAKEQVIDLPYTTLSTIILQIGAVEHGRLWNDLAISDIRFERCAD